MALAGCKGGGEAGAKPELLLYCGAGIRPPVAELAEVFGERNGVKVVTDFAGSQVLLSKIEISRAGDLYMPGDKRYVDQAAEAGLILSQRSVCYFIPAILVAKGNPKGIRGLEDLARPGIKLGLGNPEACAIGRLSRKIFEKNRIEWGRVEPNVKFQSMTVNELGLQIQSGALDAVIVWDAIARYYERYGEEVRIPTGRNIISTVDAGVLASSKHPELAERFAEFVASEDGKAVFRKHNYTVEMPR
jgi:molybdate transport system substrate-binding protein